MSIPSEQLRHSCIHFSQEAYCLMHKFCLIRNTALFTRGVLFNAQILPHQKYCVECQRYFCSTCLPKPPSSAPPGRKCSKCRLLLSGCFTRTDLQNYKVKDIRCFLKVRLEFRNLFSVFLPQVRIEFYLEIQIYKHLIELK